MFNLEKELAKKHFRVTIFGSARTKEDDKEYKAVRKLAFKCGQSGYDVITGGGPGSMQAANEGHQEGSEDSSAESVGLVIKLPWEAGSNEFLDKEKTFSKFSERLDTFMVLSNVAVITYGGLGTCLELFYAWQLTQVKHICAMPIILVGEMWEELIEWVKKRIIDEGRADPKDLHNIFVVKSIDQAMEVINKAHEVFEKEGDNYCVNYKKYKLD